jgi:hypothetical protein
MSKKQIFTVVIQNAGEGESFNQKRSKLDRS